MNLVRGRGEMNKPATSRRHQRHEISTGLHVTVRVGQQRSLRGRSLNISEGGISGIFVKAWDVGTPVDIEFSVPTTSSPVRVGGVVRSHSGHCCGFEFVDLSPDQREVISKTCRTLALLH